MDNPDLYALLELQPMASPKEIEGAYERLARLYQPDPDKDPSDPGKMQQINDAFDVLDDPARRAEYDRSRITGAAYVAPSSSANPTAAEESKPLDRSALSAVGLIALGVGAIVAAVALVVFVIVDDDGDSGLIQTDSGLQFREIISGDGDVPQPGDRVFVSYAGTLEDGTTFDSSEAFDFVLGTGAVIAGWDEGIGLMNVGDRHELIIPPELAYGESGAGPIPPNATLIFDVFLITYEPAGEAP